MGVIKKKHGSVTECLRVGRSLRSPLDFPGIQVPVPNFHLVIQLVMFYLLVFLQEASSQDVEFQLRLTLYDAANKCFFGSTWLGPYFPSSGKENGRHSVVCDEVCKKNTSGPGCASRVKSYM